MSEQTKMCPFCKGTILAAAIKCKHCKEWLAVDVSTAEEQHEASSMLPDRVFLMNLSHEFSRIIPLDRVTCVGLIVAFVVGLTMSVYVGLGVLIMGCMVKISEVKWSLQTEYGLRKLVWGVCVAVVVARIAISI